MDNNSAIWYCFSVLGGVDVQCPIITFNIFWPFASMAPLFSPASCPPCHLSIHPWTVHLSGSHYCYKYGQSIPLPKWGSLLLIKHILSKLPSSSSTCPTMPIFFPDFLLLLTLLVSTYGPPHLCMFFFPFLWPQKKGMLLFFLMFLIFKTAPLCF